MSIDFTLVPQVPSSYNASFSYSRSETGEEFQVQTFNDNFNDSSIDPRWNLLDGGSSVFIEENGYLVIHDLGNEKWELNSSGGYDLTASASFQSIEGDFNAITVVNVTGLGNHEVAGILYRAGCDVVSLSYERIDLSTASIKIERFENVIFSWSTSVVDSIELGMNRKGNEFSCSWEAPSSNKTSEYTFMNVMDRSGAAGIYSSGGGIGLFDNWNISPRISSNLTSNSTIHLDAIDVPYNQFDDDNSISYHVDTPLQVYSSQQYMVNISCAEGPFDFLKFRPEETVDLSPDVRIYGSIDSTGVDASKIILNSAAFAYSTDGTKPVDFINPHDDDFSYNSSTSSTALLYCWTVENEANLQHESFDTNSTLYMKDVNDSTWNGSIRDAPILVQRIKGDMTAITRMVLPESSKIHGGLVVNMSSNSSFLYTVKTVDETSINLTIYKFYNGTRVIGNSSIVQLTTEREIWLRIRQDKSTLLEFSYSFTGNTYNFYQKFQFESLYISEAFDIGLIVLENGTLFVDYWDISPSLNYGLDFFGEEMYYIQVNDVPFNQYGKGTNLIQFSIVDVSNVTSYSNAYSVNIMMDELNKMKILHFDSQDIVVMDYAGSILNQVFSPNSLDMEYLPSGNIMVASGLPGSGKISEYTLEGELAWEIGRAGGLDLNWPHDADRLPDGNLLIADTGNDRVVELDPEGGVVWTWRAWDHFDVNQADGATSHLNDVDRLANGNTLICLRNLDTVVEVAPSGQIVWSYGSPGSPALNHPHNPDRLLNGNTMICDSENNRVIEVNPGGNVVWNYHPNFDGKPVLGWPRDADLLPNNHILISDTRVDLLGKNAIYEVNRENGEIVKAWDTRSGNYDSDVIFNHDFNVTILNPINKTIHGNKFDIVLEKASTFDDVYYRIFDESDGLWVDQVAMEYDGRKEITLSNEHVYTIHTWANSSGGFGGGYPQDDSILVPSGPVSTLTFTINLTAPISDQAPYPGTTILSSDDPAAIIEVDNNNQTLWYYKLPLIDEDKIDYTCPVSVDKMPNNHFLVSYNIIFTNGTMVQRLIEVSYDGMVDVVYEDIQEFDYSFGIHEADYIASSDTFLIADTKKDRAVEVNREGDVVWSWYAPDHYYPNYSLGYHYHLNDADRLENGNTLISLHSLNTVIEVDPSGNIVWQYGDPANHSMLNKQHNPTRLKNGNTIISDSGNDRIVEVNHEGEVVWNTEDFPWLDLNWPRGAERLPNNNTLISDSSNHRHIEITYDGNIVWAYTGASAAYDADRIDRQSPYVEVALPSNETFSEGSGIIEIKVKGSDVANSSFFLRDSSGSLLLQDHFTDSSYQFSIELEPGTYSLAVLSDDNYMNSVLDTSDIYFNRELILITFTVKMELNAVFIILGILLPAITLGLICATFRVHRKKKVKSIKVLDDKLVEDDLFLDF
ncbi:MAG: aryl-sulfate sulfotransferase [Promethearchaeota archaeon]